MTSESTPNPYFYIPNLIGYSRIFFCVLSYVYAFTHPTFAIVCYTLGAGMDAIDGVAARYFDQCSQFGQLLDMLTDRMGTLVLYIIISQQDPQVWGICAFLIVLDTVSHWCQMFVALTQGKKTHKGSENVWLDFYYNGPYVLLVACVGNEAFIMAYYLLGTQDYATSQFCLWVTVVTIPIFIFKQIMNVVQLAHNCNKLIALDIESALEKRKQQKAK